MPIRVQVGNRIVEFPDGTPEQDMRAALESIPSEPAVSHGAEAEARPIATGGGRGTGLDVRKSNTWARNNAPAIGATLATVATGGGALPMIGAAAMGGAGGSLLRGDDLGTAATQGAIQGGIQGAAPLIARGGQAIARGLMKGTVPKGIAKDFQGQVDIPREMLNRGVFPGVPQSAARVGRASAAANAERDAAAQVVPPMPRGKVLSGLRPIHAEAMRGREPDLAEAALQHMRKSARDIGPTPMSGADALVRKDIKQRVGDAAINNPNAPFGKQLQDAERAAIVSHLRETPRMARALDESQALMAIDRVMKDASLGNPITRMRIGGPTAMALTPAGLSATAHGINQGSRLIDPRILRAMQIAALGEEQ